MNLLDLVIILVLLYEAVVGYRRGLSYSLLSVAGVLLGIVAGSWLATLIPTAVTTMPLAVRSGLAAVLILIMAWIGHALGARAGVRARLGALRIHLGVFDSLGGLTWGLLAVLAAVWYLGSVLAAGPWPALAASIRGSTIVSALRSDFPQAPVWFGSLQRLFAEVPFPPTFVGIVPLLPAGVPPAATVAGNPAINAAARETVKVVSAGCGGLIEGSGFPVAPDVILTNAHVVAGGHDTQVLVPGAGGPLAATVVFFDPERDLALLHVPGLGLTPLSFSGTVQRGTGGAVIGYPGGGPERIVPAAVDAVLNAQGANIYSQGTVNRQIYVIEANVQPGNSGGPLLNLKGRVLGVVYAKSLEVTNQAYALTSGEVRQDVSRGRQDTAPVSTQACAA